jgi:two-component system, response regulator
VKDARLPVVLAAEDEESSRALLQEAFSAAGVAVDLRLVENGRDLLDYLQGREPWGKARSPDLILLDLNMPRIDGREALAKIKGDPNLKHFPVVVLTASRAEQDIVDAYALGANTYVPKPDSFDGLVSTVRALCEFWFRTCVLPRAEEH